MRCTFCSADTAHYLSGTYEVDYCKDCRVNHYSRDGKPLKKAFFTSKQDTGYEIWVDWEQNQTRVYLSECDEPSIIMTIPHVMENVTPQNIKEKLNTLLTFL